MAELKNRGYYDTLSIDKLAKLLNPKQLAFANAWLGEANTNASEAARIAGYTQTSQKSTQTTASRLLSHPIVSAYIAKRMAKGNAEKIATADEVMEYLTGVLRGTTLSEELVVESHDIGVSQARRVQKAPSERDRLDAAKTLAKRHGLLQPKTQINVAIDTSKYDEALNALPNIADVSKMLDEDEDGDD